MAGWLGGWGWLGVAGWVVGKSDFNENPVVSLDLDLDFGLRLRVCQYFIKNPKVIANARGKSVKLFDEEASDLPMGWKMRSIEVKSNTTGTTNTIKHYLSPECKVLKTGLSVAEYLRLEGMLSTDKIIEIAQKLNVSEKKLRNLFSSAAD